MYRLICLVLLTIAGFGFVGSSSAGFKDFALICADFPPNVKSNGSRGDLSVRYIGSPAFPVQMIMRPRSCPANRKCGSAKATFGAAPSDKRLLMLDVLWCAGVRDRWDMDYEVFLRDKTGKETNALPTPVVCSPK